MDADEIRKRFNCSGLDLPALQVLFLREIAAQLAELNAKIDEIGPILQDISKVR